jgi:hypothetical protein
MTFGDEREAEEELDEARRGDRGEEGDGERDLEDQVRRVTRNERRERRVRGCDDRIVVHAAERFVRDVNELEEHGGTQETLHTRAAISPTNRATALSI